MSLVSVILFPHQRNVDISEKLKLFPNRPNIPLTCAISDKSISFDCFGRWVGPDWWFAFTWPSDVWARPSYKWPLSVSDSDWLAESLSWAFRHSSALCLSPSFSFPIILFLSHPTFLQQTPSYICLV